jgi:hypothetical protein
MHTLRKSLLTAALLAPLFSLRGQTVLSDFSSSANWSSPVTAVGDTGTFQISGNVGNYYTNGAPTDGQFAYMAYTGTTLSYNTSWTIRVDTNYATPGSIFASGSAQFINLGLMVTPGSATPAINLGTGLPTFDGFMVQSDLFGSAANAYSRDFRTTILVADTSATDGSSLGSGAVSGATASAIRLSYDSSTHLLTAGYDANGATGGYSFTSMPSQTVNVNTAWGMTGTDAFNLYLIGNSGWDGFGTDASPVIGLGQAAFDNLTAVPEPSAYAAMLGVASIGLAAWRRRHREVMN